MTPDQIALVQETFVRLQPRAGLLADLFYYRLFALDPSLRRLFANDLRLQKHALESMLHVMVEGLSHPEVLEPLLAKLGDRHAAYGVRDEDYETVRTALTWALEQALETAFTDEARAAWRMAYHRFADTMRRAAGTESRTLITPTRDG